MAGHEESVEAGAAPAVLVVDDDPSSRRIVTIVLERAGVEVLTVDRGEAALETLARQHVDVVVADWQMPGLDGPELVEAVRALPDGGPYLITLTGRSGDDALVEALEAGADDYIAKSATREALLARIRVGIRMREVRRDAAEARRERDRSKRLAGRLQRAQVDLERRNREVERERTILQAVLDTTPDGIRLIGADGSVMVSNRAFDAVFGEVVREGFAGRLDRAHRLSAVVADPEAFVALVARTVQEPELTAADEYVILESERSFMRFTTPVHDADGSVIGRLFVHHETTKEREAERLKDEFVAVASHELRTPLTSVRGYLELLSEEGDEEEGGFTKRQMDLIEVAMRNADRLTDLVGDLILYAKAEAGELTIAPTMCDAAAICREARVAAEPAARAAGVEVGLSLPEAAPLEADPTRLRQIVDNLLGNAIKFTPAGGRVLVSAVSSADRVRLTVSDNGSGIPEAEQEHLFERFFRARQATEEHVPGSGLGLAITERLVAAHGGTVGCRSVEGRGSTFTVELGIRLAPPRSGRAVAAPADAA